MSPYLFTLVIYELTNTIEDEISWCCPFGDDIMLINETSESVNQMLELQRSTVESKGLC